MEEDFWWAVHDGNVEEVKGILRNNLNLDVNWMSGQLGGATALHLACENGQGAIASILLAHPGIDVNSKTNAGQTPFMSACRNGFPSCGRLLLKDSRAKINEPNDIGYPPLRNLASYGYVGIIMWWIASGREMDLGDPGDYFTDALWRANERRDKSGAVPLLERFKENQEETRHAMRVELGWYDELAAEMFAMVVFVSDGLLQMKDPAPTPASKFFNIARKVPLELQMILCCRLAGTSKEIIQGKNSEAAFKSLAENLLWASFFTGD